MMYQFQRSFIKAASEFVDVYGRAPEEEPHLPVAAIPPAPPPSRAAVLGAEQGWSQGRLLLGGDQSRRKRRWCRERGAGSGSRGCGHRLLLNSTHGV